jgi:transmembrane sensor
MSNSDRYVPENAALREHALAWLRRLNAGEATASDIAELEKWRSTSPAHAREFTEAVLLWDVLGEAAKEAASQAVKKTEASYSNRDGTLAFPAGNRRLARRTFLAGGAALAASVAGGALVVRPPFDLWPSLWRERQDTAARPRILSDKPYSQRRTRAR